MNVNGKINVFVHERELKGEIIKNFVGSISTKDKDGNYDNASIEVVFVGKNFTQDKLNKLVENVCYTINVKDGFISFRTYETDGIKKRVWQLCIMDATVEDSKEFEPREEVKKEEQKTNKKASKNKPF